jgi:hypothetical protein
MQRVNKVNATGKTVSSAAFSTGDWLNGVVPGTVLTALTENKMYPDPYYGDVNRRKKGVIPDIADSGRDFYSYWYRTVFETPASFNNKRVWLKLHGINYRCELWLNGEKLGSLAGMFITRSFDITRLLRRQNVLAIQVLPVDVPGKQGPKVHKQATGAVGENSNGANGEIGRNVTMLMSAGWDFTFPDGVRDRNTGIWREVEIYATGDVTIEDLFTHSKLPLPDTTTARQTVSATIVNASDRPQQGIVKAVITETGATVEQRVSLAAGERKTVVFTPEAFPQLVNEHPRLWWPVNKGEQYLYHLALSVTLGKQMSDEKKIRFGVREISSDQHTPDSSRRFLVNGHPVFIRGSNWIPDAMLRNSVQRTHAELQYTRQAGINLLRLWGGGIAESDYFFDLCDELGILVWTEYWITGDTQFPEDTLLYLANVESTVKRTRNHASLAYYVSSNESTEIPAAASLIRRLDSTRGYQMQSECCGVHDGSPYKYENPMQYFENTASKRGSRVDGFNPEYGTPCLPTVESLREMMPAKDLWPINDSVWNYMDGGGFHQITTKYKEAVNEFGVSASIEEFARKAQLVGAMNYRSIWEVWNENKFGYGNRFASGFLFWYHNSPVRQTGGRLYDWSLEPTAALYYSQNALQPLHAQFNYLTNKVSVYNDFRRTFPGYQVVAGIYDLHSHKLDSVTVAVNIPADGVVHDAMELHFPAGISPVHFIKLSLKNEAGQLVSDAVYWRSSALYKGAWTLTGPAVSGFQSLRELPETELKVVANPHKGVLYVQVTNPSQVMAFFTQLKLQTPDGKSIRPSFYSDNFFTLFPGESKTVTIRFPEKEIKDSIRLVTTGYNVRTQTQFWSKAAIEK